MKTDDTIRRANRAEIGLRDSVWLEAFDACKAELTQAMATSASKEDCWDYRCELHGLEKVRSKLAAWVTNGAIALQSAEK